MITSNIDKSTDNMQKESYSLCKRYLWASFGHPDDCMYTLFIGNANTKVFFTPKNYKIGSPVSKLWVKNLTVCNKYHVINHKRNWLGNTFLDKFGWTRKDLLERNFNLRLPDWRAGALPTELSSPTLAVYLYPCSGAPAISHETIYCPLARDHAQVTIRPGKRQ